MLCCLNEQCDVGFDTNFFSTGGYFLFVQHDLWRVLSILRVLEKLNSSQFWPSLIGGLSKYLQDKC